jgi:hypothetical protein
MEMLHTNQTHHSHLIIVIKSNQVAIPHSLVPRHASHAELLSTKPHGNNFAPAQRLPCQQTSAAPFDSAAFCKFNNVCMLTPLIFAGSANGNHQGFGAELHMVGPWERQSSDRAEREAINISHRDTVPDASGV